MTTSHLPGKRFAALLLSSMFATALALPLASAGEKLPELPLTASFGPGTPGENSGPYAVTLKSTSDEMTTVSATITFSVQSHNRPQTKALPPQEIAAGGTWTIDDLAAGDRVVLTADGCTPMELMTPPGKLPLTASFGKGTPGENSGPYAVTLKSTSDEALTITATITFSVQSHNRPQTKALPPHEIAAGGTWTIDDLAAGDRILLTAEGKGQMELITPPGK